MTFTLIIIIAVFQAVIVLVHGHISDFPGSDIYLVRLIIILLSYALIPFYWIYKNEEMKKYAIELIPCL